MSRRAYFRSCAAGGIAAIVVFVVALATNGATFQGAASFTTRFYASQALSLRHGHWDMPLDILGIEAFKHGGKWYMYYGPFPALLRMPLAIFAPGVANKVTQLSMLLAFVVALFFSSRLGWKIRTMVRGDAELGTGERWAAALGVFVIGAGSALLFLASQAWVYHEAEIWGAALAIGAFDVILSCIEAPSARRLVGASALSAGAVLSRASVGLGPIAALALLAICCLVPRGRRAAGLAENTSRRLAIGFGLAAAVPVVLYAYTNYAKFGSLFVFPTDQQLMSMISPGRRNFLAHSGGSYFGLQFVPSTVLQYLRPDALRFGSLLPWIDFPHSARVIGNTTFDAIEPTSSIPSSMPAIFVLAVIGIVAGLRRRWSARLAGLRTIVVGATVGAFSVLAFGYIAQRYLSDFLPLMVICSLAGLNIVLVWSADRKASGRAVKGLWWLLGGLAVASVLINGALTASYHWTSDWVPEHESAPFIAAKYAVHDRLPGGSAPNVERGPELPYPPGPRGSVFVVGDCEGVYWSPGKVPELSWGPWQGVARTRQAGEYKLRIAFPRSREYVNEPIVVRGEPGHVQTIAALLAPANGVRFGFASEGHDDLPHGPIEAGGYFVGDLVHFKPGRVYDVVVVMDPNNGQVSVKFDGHVVFRFGQLELTSKQLHNYVFPTDKVEIGRNDVGAPTTQSFSGRIVEVPTSRPKICRSLR